MGKKTRKNEKLVPEESSSKAPEPTVSETPSKTQQMKADVSLEGSSIATKKKPKITAGSQNEKQKSEADKARLCQELSCLVQDAHTALTDLRSANAEQAFRRALALVETATLKDLDLSTQGKLLLLYGHASALTDIGQPEELAEAQRVLEEMKSFEERKFQCLVFYGIGRVFVKENRFAVALGPFLDSLQMVQKRIMPGKLTWPFTKEVVKETQPNYLKAALEDAIELCKFPPAPNAICRSEKCLGKVEIYFTDPDFKGFIHICCNQSCVIDYHPACWKAYKATSSSKKNEKEFLQGPCLTPDCIGQICSIKIFDPTGLLKHKFEESVPKAERQKKPKVNQKCTSLKKLKSKEERRIRRKQHQQARQEMQITNSEALPQKEESACQPPQKAWLLYRDRVLLQISQNMELLREEKSLPVATLASALKPWLRLDSMKNNQLALKLLSWEKEQLETVGQFVEVLLERKNRVWARVFVHVLSNCGDINPKLYNWACYLNDTGLKAAKRFLDRYSRELEELDLTILLRFEPLQEMFIEKLGSKPELLPSIGLSVTEYLKQVPAHDTRVFIWALEEHRDQYDPFHAILDEYFDMMDGHCSIIQKSNENKNNSPLKSRVRKKKAKESKTVFPVQGAMLCGRGGLTSWEEWDPDFLEDESLSFLHSTEPFRVPSHIQEQVADFELQYNSNRHRGKNFWDNNPDLTNENLYDYFTQILQEHGPLSAEDPLLVGQLDNFPPEAQNSISASGGLQAFLLQSFRFIRTGSHIALAEHSDSLQQVERGVSLDQLDHFEYPHTKSTFPNPHAPVFRSDPRVIVSVTGDVCPILPSYPPAPFPHAADPFAGTFFTESGPSFEWENVDAQPLSSYYLPNDVEEVDLYSAEAVVDVVEDDPSSSLVAAEENVLRKHAAVKVSQEMRSVAVNTELHENFEKHLGDINKMQKNIWSMEQQIGKLSSCCEKDVEDLTELKDEIQMITANIQVTETELSFFQQKLEEEVKNDQKEKKANQEILKSLRLEKEQFIEEQRSLARKLTETKANYDTVLNNFLELSNQLAAEKRSLEDEIERCKASLSSATRRILTAQTLYQEVNQGSRGSRELPVLATNNLSEAPPVRPTSAREQHKPPDRSLERPGSTVFDKAMEQLATIFPGYTRSYLKKCVEEFRSSSGGTLSSMPMEDMVGGVTQLILEHQENENSTARSTPPPPVWQKPETKRAGPKQALNVEDPCIICHEDMGPEDMRVLECRHSFHDHCIKPWLKDHNTCPTCRVHTLLPEDFPTLSNKRRQAP